jgi:hypothetical protein
LYNRTVPGQTRIAPRRLPARIGWPPGRTSPRGEEVPLARPDRYRPTGLEARIDRLESLDEIRQLAHRYALAVDTRNIDDLVELFVEDVRVGRDRVGRPALREWFVEALRRVETTIHLVANHVIDFDDADHARGVVYCRDEVDRGTAWDVGYIQYWDRYERRRGIWYFLRRDFHRWFMVDALTRPSRGAGLDRDGLTTGRLPDAWPSWSRFWDEPSHDKD